MPIFILFRLWIIERKEFFFGWSGFAHRSLIVVTEICKRKKVRGFVTHDCAEWIAGVLTEFASKSGHQGGLSNAVPEGRRWRDCQATLKVSVCSNPNGSFAKVEIIPASLRGRRVFICVPAGVEGGGWTTMAKA